MFIGVYKLEGEEHFAIYYKCKEGYDMWHSDTFSPYTNILGILDLKIKGKTYKERKAAAQELTIDWQLHFSQYSWSYGELAQINSFFEKVGKRYGLLKEFKENCIC